MLAPGADRDGFDRPKPTAVPPNDSLRWTESIRRMVGTEVVVGAVLAASGALTAFLATFGWRRRGAVGAEWFAATMACNTVWIAADLAGLAVEMRWGQVAIEYVTTLAATVVPVCWFGFVLVYTGRDHRLDARGLALLVAIPAVVVAAILTSSVHDLYFVEMTFTAGSTGPAVEATPGPLAWLNLAYFVVLLAVGLWLVAGMAWDHDRLYASQAVWLLVGTLAPVALLAARLVGAAPESVPIISMGFSLLGVAYAHGLFSHRLLDLSPAPRRIGIPEAFDDLGEGVVVVDTARTVVAINDPACRLFDCEKAAVLGSPLARVSSALADVDPESGGGSDTRGDGTAVGPRNGSTDVSVDGRTLAVSVSAVRDARERRTGCVLVVRDVTADRRRQERLDVLNRVFRHNIRNTMNAVVGPTDMLVDRLEGNDRELAETARDASERVLDLSEEVREIERMMTGPVEVRPVAVADAVADALASVGEDVAFDAETTIPDDLTLSTDPRILAVVLGHVVENAAHHAETERPTVEITAERRAGACLVHVTDEGPGIPDSELAALREGTETQLAHGSGVGLWAIHWGVTRLAGAVRFRRVDGGTRVTLWLPPLDGEGDGPDVGGTDRGPDRTGDSASLDRTGDSASIEGHWLGRDPTTTAGSDAG